MLRISYSTTKLAALAFLCLLLQGPWADAVASSPPALSASSSRATVASATNTAPTITSTPGTTVKEDSFYTYTPTLSDPDPGDQHTWTLVKAAPEMSSDASNGRVLWRPGDRYAGLSYSLELRVCDRAGACATQSWTLKVENVNDPPRIVSLPPTLATEKSLYQYKPQFLDPDRNDLHTWKLNTGPTGMSVDTNTGTLSWTPGNAQSDQDAVVTLSVCDRSKVCDQQTWKVYVRNVNDPPRITSSLPSTKAIEDVPYLWSPTVQDPDPNETLTWRLVKGPPRARLDSQSGALRWVPDDADVRTSHPFKVEVCDKTGACATASWTTTVQQVNDTPVLLSTPPGSAKQGSLYAYKPTLEDPDYQDKHVWTLLQGPAAASLSKATGELRWTPGPQDANQWKRITLKVCDKANACATQSWRVLVSNVNDSPKLTSRPPTTAFEEKAYVYQLRFQDPDPGDTHSWQLKQAPSGATLTASSQRLEWFPTQAQVGQVYRFEVLICDNAKACDSQFWKVKVENVNDAPQFTTLPSLTAREDRPYRYTPGILDEDSFDRHTWTLTQGPSGNHVLFDSRSGVLEWLPNDSEAGKTISFAVKVCDQEGACDNQSWSVKVDNINDQPTLLTTPSPKATEGKLYTYVAKATDPDPNDALTWSMAFVPPGFQFDAAKATLRWTPKRTDAGKVFSLEIRVCDRFNACALQPWKLTVINVNNPPLLRGSLPPVAYAKERLLVSFSVSDDDPGDQHRWTLLKGTAGVNFRKDSGLFTWVPATTDLGKTLVFEVQVCDNGAPSACAKKSFQVLVKQRCVFDSGCPAAYLCEARLCRKRECDASKACASASEFCFQGRCVPNRCASTQCKPGLLCQPTSGNCLPSCDPSACKPGSHCAGGRCVPGACAAFPCRPDQICDATSDPANPACVKNPCSSTSCRAGRFCDGNGRCVDDLCGTIRCPSSRPRCVKNQCLPPLSCHLDRDCPGSEICHQQRCKAPRCASSKDCKANERCLSGECKEDRCAGTSGTSCSSSDEFCQPQSGRCVKSCAGVSCGKTQRCEDGKCKPEPCALKTCPLGTICLKGDCVLRRCTGSNPCKQGRICSNAQNRCVDDPCAGVRCPDAQQVCRKGQCQNPDLCNLDVECPSNLLCIQRVCQKPGCLSNADCRKGLLCTGGLCRRDLCTGKTCPPGQFCLAGACKPTCAGVFCAKDEQCVGGECLTNPCKDVECEGLKICVNGRCKPEICGTRSCKSGRVCILDRCVTPVCAGVKCPAGQTCEGGECRGDLRCKLDADCPSTSLCKEGMCRKSTCFRSGCPEGQLCREGTCVVNPCRRRTCGQGEYCSPADGRCLLYTESCNVGERFVNGRCEADPCSGVSCEKGERCEEGECRKDQCTVPENRLRCKFGRVCFRGACRLNPCEQVECGSNATCIDGACVRPPAPEPPPVNKEGGSTDRSMDAGTSGDGISPDTSRDRSKGGMQCHLGEKPPALPLSLLLLALLLRSLHRPSRGTKNRLL